MVRRLALGSPYSKPSTATAEDSLPHPASRSLRRATPSQYSRGTLPMQRGYRSSNRLAVGSAPCARVEPVRSLESCARRRLVDRNAHSGPFAV